MRGEPLIDDMDGPLRIDDWSPDELWMGDGDGWGGLDIVCPIRLQTSYS